MAPGTGSSYIVKVFLTHFDVDTHSLIGQNIPTINKKRPILKMNQTLTPIPNFSNNFIDQNGNVYTKNHKLIATFSNNGYQTVSIKPDNKKRQSILVHRLMALTFLSPNNDPLPSNVWVNHKDGNKQNNKLSNLELTTPRENHIHARDVLKRRYVRGVENGMSKLTNEAAEAIRQLFNLGWSQHKLSRAFQVTQPAICNIINNLSFKNSSFLKVD